jgi:beta-glucosidase
MTSYTMVNGTWGSANSETINGMLKGELNFQGGVMSDWGGLCERSAAVFVGLCNCLLIPGLFRGIPS